MLRKLTLLPLLLGLALMISVPAKAAEEYSIEGRYEVINPPQPTISNSNPDKVEIVEAFWYGCPHCFRFQPLISDYTDNAPDYIELRHLPVIFRIAWSMHARAFYIADALGLSQAHAAFYEALHTDKRQILTKEELQAFFADFDISEAVFNNVFRSFAVQSNLRKSEIMQRRYGINGTPTLIVNGKYRITARLAGNAADMIKTASILAAQEHKNKMLRNTN